MPGFRSVLLSVVLAAGAWPACFVAAAPTSLPPDAVARDVDAIAQGVAATHPLPAFSVEPQRLARTLQQLKASKATSRDAAWRALSGLNPLLADGHFFVGYRSWRDEVQSHLKDGGRLFPFEVTVDANGAVRIVSELGGGSTDLAGRRIRAINGVPIRTITA